MIFNVFQMDRYDFKQFKFNIIIFIIPYADSLTNHHLNISRGIENKFKKMVENINYISYEFNLNNNKKNNNNKTVIIKK